MRQFDRVLNYVPIASFSGAKGVIFAPFLFAKTCSILSGCTLKLLIYLAVVLVFLPEHGLYLRQAHFSAVRHDGCRQMPDGMQAELFDSGCST